MGKEKPLGDQIDDMRKYVVNDLKPQLKALSDRILPTLEECDAISAELGALYEKYANVRDDAREARNGLGEIDDELRRIKEQALEPIEAQASLDAFGINEVTGKPFTVKQTADRATVALAANAEYQSLVVRRLTLERQKAGAGAVLADCDASLSEYRNRNRALVARMDNLTARLGN